MDPILMASLIEMAKLGLQGYFSLMQMAGQSEDETTATFIEEYARFQKRNPTDLPDV